MESRKTILILEGEKPASYAAIKALRRLNYTIAATSHLRFNISRFSKYVNRFIFCPDMDTDANAYKDWLLDEVKNGTYLTVFSFSDKTTRLLSENRVQLSAFTFIYQPDISIVDTALDKMKTYFLAKSLGMNLPELFKCEGKSIAEIAEILKFPVVMRPRKKNYMKDGKISYYKVTADNYFWDKNDYHEKIQKFKDELNKYDFMSYIDGVGRGYFTVVKDQETYGNFAHERIREYPIEGGASSCRKAIDFEEIKGVSLPLIKALNWSGPIMVEYKYDSKDNKYYLIEVNGRWWGSLALAIHAGVDFPAIQIDLINDLLVDPGKYDNYRRNFRSRLLFPHDVMCFFSYLSKGRFKELPAFFDRTDKEDVFDIKDWRAYLAYVFSFFWQLKFIRI